MLVEHTFVTTFSDGDAEVLASDLLQQMGYVLEREESGMLIGKKGKTKAIKATRFDELPQQVSLLCHRGRVNVAALIVPKWTVANLHTDMVMAVVRAVEQTLVDSASNNVALAEWNVVHQRVEEQAARSGTWRMVRVGCGVAIVLVLFVLFMAVLVSI